MRKALTASIFTLLCAAAGAVPFASGGSEPSKPAHHHPATHGTPKALAPIIAEARLATAKYATSLDAARKAGYTVNVTQMIPDMGWHFLNPKITGFDPNKPPILVYEKRGHKWQLGALEWVFTSKPERPPLPGARYGSFAAACHYVDGTFVPAESQDACPKTAPVTGAAFGFWRPDLVTLHVWLWYPNPSGLYASMNPLVRPFNSG